MAHTHQDLDDPRRRGSANPLETSHAQSPQPHKKGGKGWIFFTLLVAAVGIWYVHSRSGAAENGAGAVAKGAHRGPQQIPVVPVTVVQKDVPIYLDGLGTVQALNSVLIRSRVDGQIVKIAFTEGQDVKAGDVLVQIDPAPFKAAFEQAKAKKNQDEAQLANAKLDLARDAELIKQKAVAAQAYDTQKALVAQLQAATKADEAAINSAQVQLNYTTITSPLDGRVGIRQLDQGNIVHANDTNGIVTITQIQPIAVIFTLPEQNLDEIRRQMGKGDVKVFALDRDNGPVLSEGKLTVIDNEIDTTTGTIKLKAEFPNNDIRLWPGEFVNARLLLETKKNGIVVPAAVVQRGPDGSFAFVIKDNLTVEVRPIKVAQVQDGQALIEEGLKPGERVVLEGQYRLQANSKVKIATSGAVQGGAKLDAGAGGN